MRVVAKVGYCLFVLLVLTFVSGCAQKTKFDPFASDLDWDIEEKEAISDPYIEENKKVFAFNDWLYENVGQPLYDGIDYILPDIVQQGFSNFFGNLSNLPSSLFNFAQSDYENGGIQFGSFIINSTAGIFGIFDIVPEDDLLDKETLDQYLVNLGVWDIGNYLVIPVSGPTSTGILPGSVGNILFEPPTYLGTPNSFYVNGINTLTDPSDIENYFTIKEMSFDKYEGVKNAFIQNYKWRLAN